MFTAAWRIIGRVRAFLRREALDRDFVEELESHVAMLTEDNIRRGMTHEEAHRMALIHVGARSSLQDQHRATRGLPILETVLQDLRFGVRQLFRHRGFAVAAVCVFALGIATNVAIFGFIDAALIKPLPYADPSRLVTAFSTRPDRGQGQTKSLVSYLNFLEWRERNRAFDSIAAFDVRSGFVLRTSEGPERVAGLRVTSGFFQTLGVRPVLGREFRRDEEGRAAPPTVMLAYGTWQTRFGRRSDVLGQVVTLQGQPHIIIGVLPRDFYFPMAAHAEFWASIRGPQPCWESRGCRSLETVARLADGVSLISAQSALDGLVQQLRSEYGEKNPETVTVSSLAGVIFSDVRPVMLALLGGAALLLLIASVNVVSLLLARSDGRTREIAVRNALGASSSRLVLQFATEAATLVAASSLLGLALARWEMQFLSGLLSADMLSRMPYLQGPGLNLRLLAGTVVLSVVAAGLFTLMPMMRISAARKFDALKEGTRGFAGKTWQRLGRSLVVGELAIASVLLMSAGLLTKSAYRLLQVDTGFDPAQLVVTGVNPLGSREGERPGAFAWQIAQRLEVVPGVEAVGYADLLPVAEGLAPTSGFQVPGRSVDAVVEDHPVRRVSAKYFAALQATLLDGRLFTDDEVASGRNVVIINQTAAMRYFPGEDATGKEIVIGAPPARQIVGIVADIKDGPLETPSMPAAYIPFDQVGFALVIRTSQAEGSIVPAVVAAIREVRPDVLLQSATTMSERMNSLPSASLKRAAAWLMGGFAVTALMLSIVGLYGVVAYSVGQRAQEIGVRMALGAERRTVYRLVVGESAWLILSGTAIGVVCAVGVAKLMSRLLFATQPWDVPTLATAAVVLIVPALLASFVPARRAATVIRSSRCARNNRARSSVEGILGFAGRVWWRAEVESTAQRLVLERVGANHAV